MTGRIKGGKRVRPHDHGIPTGATGSLPLVAIVGRPNVGKSTLFNKLTRKRLAIVEDVPGVTRDRHYADAWMLGRDLVLVDTGGFDPQSGDPMQGGIATHVRLALEEADVVVGVLDASSDPLPADREAVKLLRQSQRPVIWIANKCDSEKQALGVAAHYELGIDRIYPVSALHSRGLGDLEEAIVDALPKPSKARTRLGSTSRASPSSADPTRARAPWSIAWWARSDSSSTRAPARPWTAWTRCSSARASRWC